MNEAFQMQNVAEVLPLSPTQSGMLFEILSSQTDWYIAPHWIEIRGDVDPDRLISVFRDEVLRHDMSRACILHKGVKRPLQIIRQQVEFPIGFDDWSGQADVSEQERVLERNLSQRIDGLDRAPLMAAHLVRRAPGHHALLWCIHHAVSDGWSLRIILDDVIARLNGAAAGGIGATFRDHLAWLQSQDRAAVRAYWQGELSGIDAPTLVAARAGAGRRGNLVFQETLDSETTRALRQIARQARATLATLLGTAWAITLRRLTERDDVVIGLVSSGRTASLPGIDRAVGPFVTVVPARFRLDPDGSALMANSAAEQAAILRRPYEPGGLAGAQGSVETQARVLFDAIFNVKELQPLRSEGDIAISDMRASSMTGFALSLSVVPGDDIRIEAACDTARLGQGSAWGIIDSFCTTLRGIAAAPDCALRDLPGRVPDPLPPTRSTAPVHLAIHQQAQKTPNAPAIVFGPQSLTYRALDGRAQALARDLVAKGVGPGDIVPVLQERSERAVIGMLGVLYAGAAYAPIDPDYPAERVAMILSDLNARFAVTDTPRDGLEPIAVPDRAAEFTPVQATPEDPAYVIFTSGSTGRPKGVIVTHGNLAWSNAARDGVYGAGPKAFLHLSSFAFDSSVVGLYWTLCSGGKLVIAQPRAEQDVRGLMAQVKAQGVTHLLALPRLWRAMLSSGETMAELDVVIVAGEACPVDLAAHHQARALGVRLFNEYGPTEATVWCTASEIKEVSETVPIGWPAPGAAVDVCDQDGHPLPPGFEGELVVRGPGVAAGYLGRPDETAVAFRDGRYRTGDFGYRREDGALVCLGRRDDMVKLRGHRVDLGEIEAAAARAAGAGDALAAIVGDAVVLGVTTEAEISLVDTLPPWSRPRTIHRLASLPRLPNGKGDRAAIAALGFGGDRVDDRRAEGFFETALATVWSALLKTDVGAGTHFFDAGGDSLMSIEVLTRLDREGIALRPGDIFEYPRLGDLAAILRERVRHEQVPGNRAIVTSHAEGTRPAFLMLHGHPRLHAGLKAALGQNRPLCFNYSHHIAGELSSGMRIERLAADAIAALRAMSPNGPYAIGGYSVGGIVAIEAARQLRDAGEEVSGLFLIDPSYDAAPPVSVSDPLRRKLRRLARAGLAKLRLAWPSDDRGYRANEAYRAVLWFYRLPIWDGPTVLFQSPAGAGHDTAMRAALTDVTAIPLPYDHQALQKSAEAIEVWTARLAAELLAAEQGEEHGT